MLPGSPLTPPAGFLAVGTAFAVASLPTTMSDTADSKSDSEANPAPAPAEEKKGPLDVVLSLFADVKAGEGVNALVLMLDVMLLLIAYYLLKTVREPLILKGGGVEAKNYATILQAVVLMGFVPLYALLTKRLKRMTLVTVTHLFFAANLVIFWILGLINDKYSATLPDGSFQPVIPGLGGIFFVWLGMFSLVIIAQFWSLANDLYTPDQGKRLFAILGIGGSVGAVAGSFLAEKLIKPLGPFLIMLVSAGILVGCLGLGWVANARIGRAATGAAKAADKPIGGKNGFALILSNKYLLLIAAVIMILNLVNTTGETILDISILKSAEESIPGLADMTEKAREDAIGDYVGTFRGDFFFWVNLVGAITQTFLVSRIFKYLGLRAALFSLPLIGVIAYGGIALVPALAFVRIMKIGENSIDYSLYNTTKQALWLPTSREDKYNAKMTIDSFLLRVADMTAGGASLLFIALGFGVKLYAVSNLVLIAAWLFLAWIIGKENQKRTDEMEKAAAA